MTAELDHSGLTVTGASSAPSASATGPAPPTGPDAELITALRSLRALGRFDEAATLVRAADTASTAGTMTPQGHAEAGPALAAVSDYAAAGVHLLLASIEPALAPTALARLAELAWIEHDQPRGRAFARAGLALDPTHHGCRVQLARNQLAAPVEDGRSGVLSQAAFFADPQGNAGDRVLTGAVRACFVGDRWHDVHAHQLFDEDRLAEVNATEGLIVGGGGLFLPDTAPNGNSGWQWNVTDPMLARIAVPLVVFGVGYNMFEGQTFDGRIADDGSVSGSRFVGSLRALVERSTFVGLRNHGSVDRVRDLLPGHLADRICWQPCPTTITDLLADPPDAGDPAAGSPGDVLLNCAYDRAGRRFGDGYGTFLAAMRDWVVETQARAVVRYVAHCVDDERFVNDLRREHGISLPVIAMYDLTPTRIHEHYRQAALVVGMRGHAGMIPFGCGTPIISLISHPKLGYFLADIDRPQWGVDVRDPHLAGRLRELTAELLDNGPAVAADIAVLRRGLADVTAANLASLPAALQPNRRLGQDETSE
jgi:hypothetical protein